MVDIDKLTLNIPKLWEKDWNTAIEMASGAQKEILVYQTRAANLLKDITDREATFERLAWLTIWTKVFAIADSLHGLLDRNSQYILEVTSRISFEQMLQIQTIMKPIIVLNENKSISVTSEALAEETAWKTVLKRLQAYTAWCLWNDRLFLDRLLNFKTLEAIWDPLPARNIPTDPNKRAQYEQIFGELDLETDDLKLRKGRFRQQDRGHHNLHRIKTWLADPRLSVWINKIERLKSSRQTVSFFSLLDESEASIRRRLKSWGKEFMYVSYLQSSLMIHGSTMDQFLIFRNGVFTPKFNGNTEEVESSASFVASTLNNIILSLHILKNHLWPSHKIEK